MAMIQLAELLCQIDDMLPTAGRQTAKSCLISDSVYHRRVGRRVAFAFYGGGAIETACRNWGAHAASAMPTAPILRHAFQRLRHVSAAIVRLCAAVTLACHRYFITTSFD